MPRANLRASGDTLPGAITVDSGFLLAAIYENDPRHRVAWPVYARMVAEEVTAVVCEPLLRIEVMTTHCRLARDLDRAELRQWVEDSRERAIGQRALFRDPLPTTVAARREYAVLAGEALIRTWLLPLPVARVRLTYRLLEAAKPNMTGWGLKSHDAIWLAVAQEVASRLHTRPALASVDADFDKVSGLDVWGRR